MQVNRPYMDPIRMVNLFGTNGFVEPQGMWFEGASICDQIDHILSIL